MQAGRLAEGVAFAYANSVLVKWVRVAEAPLGRDSLLHERGTGRPRHATCELGLMELFFSSCNIGAKGCPVCFLGVS